jgi:hypothetical protein
MLGIAAGTEFAVYSSKDSSFRNPPLGYCVAEDVGATISTLILPGLSIAPGAVALQKSRSASTFYVEVTPLALEAVETAVAQEPPDSECAWPQFTVASCAHLDDKVHLKVAADTPYGPISFLYRQSSFIRRLGLACLHRDLVVIRDQEHPAQAATRVRDILLAAGHFFQYLLSKPTQENRCGLSQDVEVRLCELAPSNVRFGVIDGKICRRLEAKNYLALESDETADGYYRVKAAKSDSNKPATPYGIEIINHLDMDLFVWAFFFDCSTLSIRESVENLRCILELTFRKAPTLSLVSPHTTHLM